MQDREKGLILILLIMIVSLIALKSCDDAMHYKHKNTEVEVSKRELKKILDTVKIGRKTKTITIVETVSKNVIKEVTKIEHDTVVEKDTVYLSPVYKTDFNNKWFGGNARADKDTFEVNLTYYDRLLIRREQDRGLFRNKPINVSVETQNPYISVSNSKTYKIKNKEPLMNVSAQLGGGFNLITGKPVIYAGVGVGIKIIR